MPLRGGGRAFIGPDAERIRRTEFERRTDTELLFRNREFTQSYDIIKTDHQAAAFERVRYDPSNGNVVILAPANPTASERFGVKNVTNSTTSATIDGNGKDIEDPLAAYAVSASFTLSASGGSVEWEYDGTNWVVI